MYSQMFFRRNIPIVIVGVKARKILGACSMRLISGTALERIYSYELNGTITTGGYVTKSDRKSFIHRQKRRTFGRTEYKT